MRVLSFRRFFGFAVVYFLIFLSVAHAAPPFVQLSPPTSPVVPAGQTIRTSGSAANAGGGAVETVEIFSDGVSVGEATLLPNGTFFLEWNPGLPGTFNITAEATDSDMNTATSAPVVLTVVPGTPPVVSLDPLPAEIPLGVAPLITGKSGDVDGTIQGVNVSVNTLEVGGAVVEANGDFSFNGWTPTVPGSYTIEVRAIDNLNNASAPAQQTIEVVDGVRPAAVVFDAIVPKAVGVGDVVPLTGRAVDPSGAIDQVAIFVNGTNEGDATVDSAGNFRFDWEAVGLGSFQIEARAFSAAGQVATSGTLSVEVSSGKSPQASLTVPPPGSIAVGSTSSIIGSASDADSLLASVEVFVNGGSVGDVDELLSSGSFRFAWVPTFAGEAILQVLVEDEEGLQGVSDPVNVTVVQGFAPVIALSPPPVTQFGVGSTISLIGSAGDLDGTVSAVEIFANDTLQGTATLSDAGVFSFDWIVTAPGTYEIRARAVDNRGLSTTSETFTVEVGANAAPTIDFESPPSPVTTGSNLRLTATAEDFDGNVTQVSFFANGSLIGTVEPPERGNPFTVGWIPRSEGTFSLVAVATDNRGATTASAARSVAVQPPVGTRPIITPTSLPDSSFGRYFLGSSILLTANASDSDGSVVEVTFEVNGQRIDTFTKAPYAADFTFDASGEYVFTALARDDSGNVSATTVVLEAIDANSAIPEAEITSPASGTAVAVGESITVTAEADGFGNELSGIDLVVGSRVEETSSVSPLSASVRSDVAIDSTARAFAYFTRDVTVIRIVDGEEVETQVAYTASGVSAPVSLRFEDPVQTSGFGVVVPLEGWSFSSSSFGTLIFPDGDPTSPWAFAYDIDTWLGAVGDGRLWSFDYGFVSEVAFRERTFSSALFGDVRWRKRGSEDTTVFVDSEAYGALGKASGAPFFYSFVLLEWLGVSNGAGVYSPRFEWLTPFQRYVVDSSALGRLFLQPLQPGTVFSVREGGFVE